MKRCLLWGNGVGFKENYYLLKYHETLKNIEIVGITSKDIFYKSFYGYKFYRKDSIKELEFDYLIIMSMVSETIESIKKDASVLGIDDSKIMPIRVMQLYGFDFEKYEKIQSNIPTIFAPNCWGGVLFHSMNLKFNSPFINMFELHEDYIKFLKNPKHYLQSDLKFIEMRYEPAIKRNYPIAQCGDINLYFNHYTSFEEANACWKRRKKRVNWDNIIVMFYDQDENLVKEFLNLPYDNKLCFTTCNIDNEAVVSVKFDESEVGRQFFTFVNGTANGTNCLDLFELLLNKKVRLADGVIFEKD